MTEDDQLPFDGPSDEQQNQPTLNARDTSAEADVASSARDRDDHSDESVEVNAPASEEPIADRSEQPPTPGEYDVAAQPSASGTVLTGTSESSATGAAVSESAVPAQTRYFLTNRMNLNGILSSRLVAPRESFQKYYTDLLQQTPGWVPLLRDAPTPAQIETVTSERGAGAPVLVEFPLDVLGKVRSDAPVVYVPAVALSEAVAIHLPSERDLREHRARGYSNVHPHDQLLRVTPELFQSDASDVITLSPASPAAAVDWRSVDRIRGAINAAFASVSSGEQLVLAAALLGATKLPAAVSVPAWFGWLDLDDHAAPDARPEPDNTRPDHVGFRAAYDVLGDRDVSEAWSPNEVLDAVESRVREAGLADDAADAMVQNLARVRSIVNVEVDFEPFRPSARALVSAKALLLVLLRQELDQLLGWPDDETGADDVTRVLAAALAGRLRGLARESTELRSLALDDLTAAWAVRVAHGGPASLGKAQLVANSRGTSLKINGVEVASQGALLPDLVSKYQKTAEAKKESLRIKVSRAMGWPVEHRVRIPAGASVETDEALITIATSHEVVMDVAIDEDGFVHRLESLTGGERRRAAEAFAARR
ncbi:hypothetical protein GUY44_09325 [Pimelobacter simplex]|uniref:Uncharacterized protein n=1 Tax=Nocardioides simplex TaxID=2045 RepID=A0A0J9YH34_NOCSI|nr:hypothetical protein [Pimelobacter simplex]AIY15585.1 hypothetical protein KR76_00110 [Pimelobacter simplex]MCG8150678.1 hypothetical protein [Pimelobacter simplex]GEB15201.1 hypothetical protein NSI01_35160 [Pimelobacter simplex]SFM85196.1 hypothetical protein SAMN05421671_3739 [Pimelobacter simplex]